MAAGWQLQDLATSSARQESAILPIADETDLRSQLERLGQLSPHVVSFRMADGEYLQVGIGGPWAFVEHCVDEPWRAEAAVRDPTVFPQPQPESVWFVCGGQDSEIPSEYLMPVTEAINLVAAVFRSGRLPESVQWELQ